MKNNLNFGILNGQGAVTYAPNPLVVGDMQYFNGDADLHHGEGWKTIVPADAPEPEEGYVWWPSWEETDTHLTRIWTRQPIPEPKPGAFEMALQNIIEE